VQVIEITWMNIMKVLLRLRLRLRLFILNLRMGSLGFTRNIIVRTNLITTHQLTVIPLHENETVVTIFGEFERDCAVGED
jgi:hypothetical protein